jgi:hypothetical protein
MIFTLLQFACQSEAPLPNQSTDSIVFNEQDRYADFVRGLQFKSESELPAEVHAQEEILTEIDTSVLSPLRQAIISQDAASMFGLFATTASVFVPKISPAANSASPSVSNYVSDKVTDLSAAENSWAAYLNSFSHLDDVDISVHGIKLDSPNLQAKSVQLALFWDLRGEHQSGLLNERAMTTLSLKKTKGQWRITDLSSEQHTVVQATGTAFADVTKQSGLDNLPNYPRLEALRRGGYAISVSDIDSDGDADMFVGGWGGSRLFTNDGKGNFTDVTQSARIGEFTKVKAAAISDMDNDGDQDIVLSRFVDLRSEDIIILENRNGVFDVNEEVIYMTLEYDRAMPLTVADFNQDGFNDIYVGFPGVQDFTFMNDEAPNKNTQGIFYADGKGGYIDQTVASGLDVRPEDRETMETLATYPHAVATADFNGDGNIDIMVADDRRGNSKIYKNIKGLFSEESASTGLENKAWAMGIAVGDYDNDGLNDIYFSNIDFLAAKRIQSNHPDLTDIFQGNRLYRNQGDGTFSDVTQSAGVGWAGEAAAGATWFDYDSDGDLDLYVTNGLWTGPKSQDLSSTFVRAYIADSHDGSQASKTDLDALSLQDPGFYHLLLDSLSNFSGDLTNESSFQDVGLPSLSLGGNQRNVLFQNNGDGTFTDVAYVVGLDSIDDGYMASVADVNLDGKPDVILRNCDPGTPAYTYPSLRIYQNQSTAPEQLAIQLRGNGVDTNVDSIGAQIRVFAKAGSAPMIRELATVNGAAQSENVAFFGLGEIAEANRVEVLWPNGDVTEHGPFTIGRHTIVQPK